MVVLVVLLQTRPVVTADELENAVEATEKSVQEQVSGLTVEKAAEKARKTVETMRLPENIHAQEGQKAARQSVETLNAPAFQEKLRCQMERIQQSGPPQEQAMKAQDKGTLTAQDSAYLFLSSSLPEAMVNRYLIDIGRTGEQRIAPVLFGLPQGLEGKRLNANYFSRVMQVDPECRDTPESPCQRLAVPLRVNPDLFTRYTITEVPALVYDNGQDSWSIHGEAELAYLLEKISKASKNPTLANISTRLRGGQ